MTGLNPICGRCLHVLSEHRDGRCLPTIEGGSPCACTIYVEFYAYSAEQLRLRASSMLAEADYIDRQSRR